jgi:hypothetical protein
MRSRLLPALLLLALLAAGCSSTSTWHFRAVDSQTGQPLSGVSTVWVQSKTDWHGDFHKLGPTNLPPSQADGLITIPDVHKSWAGKLTFFRSGYSDTWCEYSDHLLWPYSNRAYSKPRDALVPTNGIITVLMGRL